ncbi:hypothetical protein ACFWJT_15790 [Streptomyces sp. NPDC127069]|uniref:hypothetical protein n=1 Tax=Streptomyces sp. NPDC127069 TaxID=3347128 RepID=UPI0036640174
MTENEPETIVDRRGREWRKTRSTYQDGLTRYSTVGEHHAATAHEIKTGRVGSFVAYREALEQHRKNAG